MPLENRSRKDTTDQSQADSSRSGNPERVQQLRKDAQKFTPDYAEKQRAYAASVERGEDRGKREYDPNSERPANKKQIILSEALRQREILGWLEEHKEKLHNGIMSCLRQIKITWITIGMN